MSSSDPPLAAKREVLDRAGDSCECCGTIRPSGTYVIHHRQGRRGRHTDNRPVNLMVVIPGHHDAGTPGSIHDRVARSRELGHIVSKFADPAAVPITLRRLGR